MNVAEFAAQAIQTIKLMMKKKLQLKFQIHKTLESLYDFIPIEYLPSDYNGTQKSCREISSKIDKYIFLYFTLWQKKYLKIYPFVVQWAEALRSQEMTDWFFEQDKYKSDETQRPKNNSLDSNNFVGVHGTFRKLNID